LRFGSAPFDAHDEARRPAGFPGGPMLSENHWSLLYP